MVLSHLLKSLGVSGSIVTVAMALVTLYHGRSILHLLGRVATWMRVVGIVGFLGVLATAGLIPGVTLSVDFGTLGAFLGDAGGAVWSFVKPLLPLQLIS